MALTHQQLDDIRVRLEHDLAETTEEVRDIDEQVDSFVNSGQEAAGGVDNHLGDISDVVYEKERLLTVRARLVNRKDLIEAALLKLDRGNYGYCENCGQPIPPDRLEALPYATYCISCQEKFDRQRGGRR